MTHQFGGRNGFHLLGVSDDDCCVADGQEIHRRDIDIGLGYLDVCSSDPFV